MSQIGKGAFGEVYLAVQQSLQRTVALKVLRPGVSLKERAIERFRREATAAAKLNHPYIARVLSVGEAEGQSFFAMDYVEGPSLAAELGRLRDDSATDEPSTTTKLGSTRSPDYGRQVADFIRKCAEALEHAHEHGVIHRDIKPQNILIQPGGDPSVVDFGLAKELEKESMTMVGDIAGTLLYMSPEQALAKRVGIDRRTDVFSLGVVLYELLTLDRPFGGGTLQRILYEISFKDPQQVRRLNPRVHRDLETICMKALEKDPERRFQSMREFAAELERFLHGESLRTRPTWPVVRLTRAVLRRRALTSAVALGAALVAVVAWGVVGANPDRFSPKITILGPTEGLSVFTRRIDESTGRVGPEVEIGVTPIREHALEAGSWRIVVVGDGGHAKLTRRYRRDGEVEELAPRLVPTADAVSGMVAFAAERFTFEPPGETARARREVDLEAFWIDEREVSIAQFKRFLRATGHPRPKGWISQEEGARRETEERLVREVLETTRWDDRPVACVTWYDARAYAEWVGKRLPTAVEWSRVARGRELRPYPFVVADALATGELERRTRVNRHEAQRTMTYLEAWLELSANVGSLAESATPEGVLCTLGNVKEWTETSFAEARVSGGEPESSGNFYILGAAWDVPRRFADLLQSSKLVPTATIHSLGFRCAKSRRG